MHPRLVLRCERQYDAVAVKIESPADAIRLIAYALENANLTEISTCEMETAGNAANVA